MRSLFKTNIFHFLRKGGIIEAMPNATISSINSPSISLVIGKFINFLRFLDKNIIYVYYYDVFITYLLIFLIFILIYNSEKNKKL